MPLEVVRLKHYSLEIATGIGSLMPQLDPRMSNAPTPQKRLEKIIHSPERDQLVALNQARVVGAATMNIVMGAGKDSEGWLEDFIVDQSFRGQGVADALWNEMQAWCRDKELPGFSFETESYRTAAIAFYQQHGAQLVEGTTTHYTMPVPQVI